MGVDLEGRCPAQWGRDLLMVQGGCDLRTPKSKAVVFSATPPPKRKTRLPLRFQGKLRGNGTQKVVELKTFELKSSVGAW